MNFRKIFQANLYYYVKKNLSIIRLWYLNVNIIKRYLQKRSSMVLMKLFSEIYFIALYQDGQALLGISVSGIFSKNKS